MDGSDYLSTTDYPSDKLPIQLTGSFVVVAHNSAFSPRRTSDTKAHGQTVECMPQGIWSIDGAIWYPMGVTPPDTSSGLPRFQTTEVDVYCDEVNIYVMCSNWTSGTPTIQYVVDLYTKE